MANINSFPNNQDVYIGAESVMKWLHGRTSGVFAGDGNAAVAAVQNAMAVTVTDGVGWLTDSDQNGIVWWNSNNADNGALLQLTIDAADGALNRIDRVIVEWVTTNYTALPEIKVLKGTSGSAAVAPALTNNNVTRQISLAQISIPAGTTALDPTLITDERLDPSVCGLVTDGISIDTTMVNNQLQAYLDGIAEQLNDLQAGTGVELRKLMFTNTSVATSAFVSDSTYEAYPYRAAIALTGVLPAMVPEVTFGLADAVSGKFAPVSQTYAGGVYIYATEVPEAAITIPTIICWRDNA